MKIIRYIFPILLLLALVACEPDRVCHQDMRILMGVEMYGVGIDTAGNRFLFRQWDSITIYGAGSDTAIYNNAKQQKVLYMPLRCDTALSVYELTWHGLTDTLYVHHSNDIYFIDLACGCKVYHLIDSVWGTEKFIDSCKIVNAAVSTYNETNISLYIHQ